MNENGEIVDVTETNGGNEEAVEEEGSSSEFSSADLAMEHGDVEVHGNDATSAVGVDGTSNDLISKRCVSEAQTNATSEKVRPLYMCPGEQKLVVQLTDLIEKWNRLKGGLSFVDPNG